MFFGNSTVLPSCSVFINGLMVKRVGVCKFWVFLLMKASLGVTMFNMFAQSLLNLLVLSRFTYIGSECPDYSVVASDTSGLALKSYIT